MTNGISTKKYGLTLTACYVGYVIQAIVNNLSPLLFVQFGKQFGVSQSQLSILIFVNFGLQILVDAVSPKIVEKIGYRAGAIIAQTFSAVGLICLGSLPFIMPPYAGIIIAALLMAVGGGFVEVIISPVVEALPLGNKSGAMCFLHSFYCWGHIITVLVATLYFNCFGVGNWQWLPISLSVIPVLNCIIFARCPIETLDGDENPSTYKSIFTAKGFIVFPVLMLAAGAAEQSIAQWASAFAEKGLGVNKTMGDILGTCLFAFFMAISRTVYGILGDKIDICLRSFAYGSVSSDRAFAVGVPFACGYCPCGAFRRSVVARSVFSRGETLSARRNENVRNARAFRRRRLHVRTYPYRTRFRRNQDGTFILGNIPDNGRRMLVRIFNYEKTRINKNFVEMKKDLL